MKTASFFHHFDGEEIQPKQKIHGKWDVSYDYSDGKVYDIYVCDMSKTPDYLLVSMDVPNNLYKLCEEDLTERYIK